MSLRATFARGPLGFGAAPLGNMFRDIPDDEAAATVERPGRPALATSTPPRSMVRDSPRFDWASSSPRILETTTSSAPR
jgi:hypothetical protein